MSTSDEVSQYTDMYKIGDYMTKQKFFDKQYRSKIIIDFYRFHSDMKSRYEFCEETVFRAINILDRFLTTTSIIIPVILFPFLAASSYLIAAKIEEDGLVGEFIPMVENLVDFIIDNYEHECSFAYVHKTIINIEIKIMKKLNFDFSIESPYNYSIYNDDTSLICYVLRIALTDYEIVTKYQQYTIIESIAIIIGFEKVTNDDLVLDCIKKINTLLYELDNNHFSEKKYSQDHSQIFMIIKEYC
jgi:hypothetical protein